MPRWDQLINRGWMAFIQRSGWSSHLQAPSPGSEGIRSQTLQRWALYVALSMWYQLFCCLCSALKFWDLDSKHNVCLFIVDCWDLLQVAAVSTLKQIIKSNSLWFRCWFSNTLREPIIRPIVDASLQIWNTVYIALGYIVDDTTVLSPLKSPTTLATAPDQE